MISSGQASSPAIKPSSSSSSIASSPRASSSSSSCLRRRESPDMSAPIPGQQLVQPMSRMGGDADEDIREPGLRVDAVHFRRDDEAVHSCGAPPSAIRAAEQPGLPSKSDASQAPFGGIVGETHASIFQEQREARPSLQDVVERLG